MNQLRTILILTLLVASRFELFGQNSSWKSMDGPYCPEQRTHLRFPNGDRLYFGTNTGTVRTTDGGKNWTFVAPPPATNFTVNYSPKGELIGYRVYGTTDPTDSYSTGYQFYSSSDGGEHWTMADLQAVGHLNGIAFGGGDTVYESDGWQDNQDEYGFEGVNRSTDAGITWTNVLAGSYRYGLGIADLYAQLNNIFVHRLFLSVNYIAVSEVLRSSDGGSTWQSIKADRVLFHPPNNLLRMRGDDTTGVGPSSTRTYLELSTDNGSTWAVTLTADSGFSSLVSDDVATLLLLRKPGFEIFRSTDAGHSWVKLGSGPPGEHLASIAFYGKTHLVGRTPGGTFFRSTDFGASWTAILDLEGHPLAGTVQPASDSLFVVADWRGNWLESDDAGGSWRSVVSPFPKTRVTSLLSLPSGTLLTGTTTGLFSRKDEAPWEDHSSLQMHTNIGNQVWCLSYPSGPFVFAAFGIDPNHFERYSAAGGIAAYDTQLTQTKAWWYTYSGPAQSVYALGPHAFLAGAGNSIGRTNVDPASEFGVYLNGNFTVSSPGWTAIVRDSAGTVWAGNDSSGLYMSLDSGITWNASNAGLTNSHILSMAVASSGTIFIGTRGGGVFSSSDQGKTWTNSGLSGDSVQALLPGTNGVVYAGTPKGVTVTSNAGDTWSDISSGLLNKDVHVLAQGTDGSVYCGTSGEGVYKLIGDIGTSSDGPAPPGMPLSFALEQNYPNPFNPRTVIRSQTPEVSNVRIVIYDVLGREVAVLVNDRRAAGQYEDSFDGSRFSSGIYICRMTAGSYVQSRKMLLIK